MKKIATTTLCAILFAFGQNSNGSIGLVLNFGKVDAWTSGAVWLVSAGGDGVFTSPFVNNGVSLAGTGDTFIGGLKIDSSNNSGGGELGSISVPFTVNYGTGIAQNNKLAIYYISASSANVDALFDLTAGTLKSGLTFGASGGTVVSWATYAGSATPETAGGGLDPAMGWILPADSGASGLYLSAFTLNDPSGGFADSALVNGSLNFSNSVSVIPEPSSFSMVILTGLIATALRRKRS